MKNNLYPFLKHKKNNHFFIYYIYIFSYILETNIFNTNFNDKLQYNPKKEKRKRKNNQLACKHIVH